MSLFDPNTNPVILNLPDADIIFYEAFLDLTTSESLFSIIFKETEWKQDYIKIFGKTYPQPRLTALYANNTVPYRYSNITMHPTPFTDTLLWIKKKIEKTCQVSFTTCLLNLYRDGNDSNGWHSDNEKELGEQPYIASLSIGVGRWFHLKHKNEKSLTKKIFLNSGSLLIMKNYTQKYWLHQIPKSKKIQDPRINLTFRIIQ